MNYAKHYNALIDRARNRILEGYVERHHTIPRCLGGTDNKENIVELTAEEHYVAHQLLVKMNPGHAGLASAAFLMTATSPVGPTRPKNKTYSWLRKCLSESLKGRKYSNETKEKLRQSAINQWKKLTESEKEVITQKMRDAKVDYIPWNKGIKTGIKTSGCFEKGNKPWNTGKPGLFLGGEHTNETKKHLSEVAKARPKVKCPHCEKVGQRNAMMQHHFEKCKFREAA